MTMTPPLTRSPCTLTVETVADVAWYVMRGPTGEHTLAVAETSAQRLAAHWRGFLSENIKIPTPGDGWDVHANQGVRSGEVIAVLPGGRVLVEYTMPGGSTALRLVDVFDMDPERTLSYSEALARFRHALQRGIPWAGRAQTLGKTLPSYAVAARRRRDDEVIVENENGTCWVGRPVPSVAVL